MRWPRAEFFDTAIDLLSVPSHAHTLTAKFKMMIDYGLAEIATSVQANFLSAITIYFSIATAYVIAAFVAGSKLTGLQLAIVNIGFTIAAGIMGTLTVLLFSRFIELAEQVEKSGGPKKTPLVDFSLPLSVLVIIVFLGCMLFMWSVRQDSK